MERGPSAWPRIARVNVARSTGLRIGLVGHHRIYRSEHPRVSFESASDPWRFAETRVCGTGSL